MELCEHISQQFKEILDKCPDFYEIGIRRDLFQVQKREEAYFLGKVNENLANLFMPDRTGFVYYNEALDNLPIIFDTGASISVTPDFRDFVTYNEVHDQGLLNITGESQVKGKGFVKWTIYNDQGCAHEIEVEAYFVPTARVRLFSVQSYLGQQEGTFVLEGAGAHFTFQDKKTLPFKTFDVNNNKCLLPVAYLAKAVDA